MSKKQNPYDPGILCIFCIDQNLCVFIWREKKKEKSRRIYDPTQSLIITLASKLFQILEAHLDTVHLGDKPVFEKAGNRNLFS